MAAESDVPPAVRMYEMLYSSLVSQLLIAVAELGVADALGDRPCEVAELADRIGCDAPALYRALRALASVGVFTEVAPRVFGPTPLAATLRGDGEPSMRDLARYLGLPERQAAFAQLAHTIRTGRPAFDHVHGTDWWSYCADRPEASRLYQSAMGSVARAVTAVSMNAYDLSGVRRLVDVGAGHAHLTAELLRRYPALTAVVFDLPGVVNGAGPALERAGVADRAEVVGGDFFAEVPGGAEVYLLSWTLHDWDDADAVRILANVRKVMPADARLLVVDEVLPEGDAAHFGKFDDIAMLSLVDGHTRTEAEFRALFTAAGLRFEASRPTVAPGNVIVAAAS